MKQVVKSKPGYGSQEKELEHVLSNLHSLKKLYSLLYVEENDLKRKDSKNLDEQARLLLKKLLDGATQRALKSHSQIISAQLGASVQTLENNSQSQDHAQSCHATTAEEDDQSLDKKTSPAIAGGETRSGDLICQKCNRKRQDPANVRKTRNRETQNPTRDQHVRKRVSEIRVGSEPSSDIVVGESKKKPEDPIDVYKEVAQAIQQIEGEIHADQREKVVGLTNDTVRVGSMATRRTELEDKTGKKKPKDANATGKSQSLPRQKISNSGRKTKVSALPGESSLSHKDTNLLPSQVLTWINKESMTSPGPTKGGKSSLNVKNELAGRLMSQKAPTMSQSGKQPILEKHDSVSRKARKLRETHRDSMQRREKRNSRMGTSKPSSSFLVVGPTLMRNESLNPVRRKSSKSMVSKSNQPHEITKRPTLRDHTVASTRSRNQSNRAKSGTHKERKVIRASDDKDSDGTHRGRKVIGAMDDSDSCSTCTSQDESEDTSWTYREMGPTSSEGEEEDPQQYETVGPTSLSRRFVPRDQMKDGFPAKDRISRWRRLKDKLVIFHHHHHHHHVNDVDTTQVRHATPNHLYHKPSKKPWHRVLHRPSKEDNRKLMAEIYGERVAERTPRKHQQGYFHALLDSLWRHVWHSKRSKPTVTGIKRLGKGPKYGKVAKKIHWWQKFRKRGVKLASSAKPCVNGALKTKRLYLHAGKMS